MLLYYREKIELNRSRGRRNSRLKKNVRKEKSKKELIKLRPMNKQTNKNEWQVKKFENGSKGFEFGSPRFPIQLLIEITLLPSPSASAFCQNKERPKMLAKQLAQFCQNWPKIYKAQNVCVRARVFLKSLVYIQKMQFSVVVFLPSEPPEELDPKTRYLLSSSLDFLRIRLL